MNINNFAKNLIKKNEGLRLKPYKCTEGVLTIGYGYNLENNFYPGVLQKLRVHFDDLNATQQEIIELMKEKGITMCVADFLFNISFMEAERDCKNLFSGFDYLSIHRQAVLLDMAFNLGYNRFSAFKNTIKAINSRDWKRAHNEMLDSKWAQQVPNRARSNAYYMAAG